MMFPGYSDYGVTAWMVIGSLVAWLGLIAFAAILIIRLRIDRDESLNDGSRVASPGHRG